MVLTKVTDKEKKYQNAALATSTLDFKFSDFNSKQ